MRNNQTITINKISEEAKASLRTRVISAIVASLIGFPCVILGDWFFIGFVVFILFIAVVEIIRCAKKKYSRWAYACMFVACIGLTFWPIFRALFADRSLFEGGHAYLCFNSIYLSVIVAGLSIFALFYVIMWDENFTVRDACFIFTMGLVVSIGFQSILYLRFIPLYNADPKSSFLTFESSIGSLPLICYVLLAVFGTDTGAYFVGMLFGKRKINERISPKKTWAGFWGGLIISSMLSFGFGIILAATNHAMLPVFDMDHWFNILILSLLLPPFATLGDFVFSAIKRYYGIKDFGKIMPGHGGVLDRFDSLLFASIIAAGYTAIAMSLCGFSNINPLL